MRENTPKKLETAFDIGINPASTQFLKELSTPKESIKNWIVKKKKKKNLSFLYFQQSNQQTFMALQDAVATERGKKLTRMGNFLLNFFSKNYKGTNETTNVLNLLAQIATLALRYNEVSSDARKNKKSYSFWNFSC